jgi:type I restriction enzyme, S subunit
MKNKLFMNLPQGWIKCKFSDIATIRNGYAFSKNDFSREQNKDNEIPLIKQTQLDGNKVDLSKACYLPTNYLRKYSDFLIIKNDVLIRMSGSIGKLCIYQHDFPALQNQRTGLIKTYNNEINNKFFWLFLQTIETKLMSGSKGVGVQNISSNDIEDIEFSLPPLSEQQRIVAKIDSLFSELENGVTLLKTIKTQLTLYRQAVLKWAFEQGHSAKIVKLCDIADIVGGITKGRDLTKCETIFLPYLRVANVQDGYLDLTNIKKIKLKLEEKNKYLLQMDDVLYTEGGDKDKLGRGTIWKNEIKECVHQNHIFRARINTKMALPKYVAYFSLTKSAKDYFFKKAKQTVNLASINMTVLRLLSIPLPNLPEQLAIVSAIESRLSVCDKLEQTIDQTLALSAFLRQSILKKAFEGQLVPQDPNDEPAEKLLERIKVEKAAVLAKQKQTRKRGKK